MLPKARRIQKTLFSKAFLGGRRLASSHFTVQIAQTDKNIPSRFAFSISKKVCKRAVDRNRLRRQGYSIISKNIKKISAGFLFLFIFKKGVYPISSNELEKEICGIIDKH